MVVSSPMWPPLSVPSATTAVAPRRSMSLASATLATTGTTLTPACFHSSMYLAGLPAPVTATGTCSSATTWATSSANGLMSMTFTPKGLSVFSRSWWIWSRSHSALAFMAAMMPRPPASLTAAARLASAIQAMPP